MRDYVLMVGVIAIWLIAIATEDGCASERRNVRELFAPYAAGCP